jgi:hypothetical protein
MLKEMGACEEGIDYFLECFPSGKAELTKKNIYKFWGKHDNNIDFFDWFFGFDGDFSVSEDDCYDWDYSNKSPEKAWAILKKYKKN